jgi:hypothetical protein
MAEHKVPGRGKMTVKLDKIPAADVTQPATPAKTGLEVVREKFQAHADQEAAPRVVVWDHDHNQVLFSGSPKEFDTLKRAIAQGG